MALPTYLPLAGYRVLEFARVWAGPLVGQMLADMGAEVVRVESRLNQDQTRTHWPAMREGDPNATVSFLTLNRNKRSISLNLSDQPGKELLQRLVAVSDVVTENYRVGVARKLGLDYPSLRKANPAVILISLSPVGQTGPLSWIQSYGQAIGSLAGLEGLVGYPGEAPIGSGTGYTDPVVGCHGAFAVLAALYHRQRTGQGQYIDLSQVETGISVMGEMLLEYQRTGQVRQPDGNRHRWLAPHNCYPCKGQDQWIAIAVTSEDEWRTLVEVMGRPAWALNEQYAIMASRWEHQEELDQRIGEWTRQHDKRELSQRLQAAGVAAVPTLDALEVRDDPHFRARGVVGSLPAKNGEKLDLQQPHWRLSDTPGRLERIGPDEGEHNREVYGELLGLSQSDVERMTQERVLY